MDSDYVAVEQGAVAEDLGAAAGQVFVVADAEELEAETYAEQPDGTWAETELEAEDVTAVIPVSREPLVPELRLLHKPGRQLPD